MAPSIGVNLRVTGHCSQGGRKHMEDMFSVAYQQTEDDKDLEYAYFGIFDGHGGREAAMFAKDHLMDFIVNQKAFWSESDDEICRAIKEGFIQTHYAMWGELETWPKTASGLPSTAGTTASIAFIRKGKIYIGHVGDSQIILGYQNAGQECWEGMPLTREHKPESYEEISRIHRSGGKVVSKQGVPRVVWNRPRLGHKGPVRRSTLIDEIPFLAVARSLGDLWSYNSELDEFVVSPEPDVEVVNIKVGIHKCLIFGTDGLWNMMNPNVATQIVRSAEHHNEKNVLDSTPTHQWINPSKSLVDRSLHQWSLTNMRADNTSAVTLMLDPPGPPRAEVLRKKTNFGDGDDLYPNTFHDPKGCVAVFTRHPVASDEYKSEGDTSVIHSSLAEKTVIVPQIKSPSLQSNSQVNVQINEVSSSIEEAKVGVDINADVSKSLSENGPSVKSAPEIKPKRQSALPCIGRTKVLQNTSIKNRVEALENTSYTSIKRLRDVSFPSDPRYFRRRPGKDEEDTSDTENCVDSWSDRNPHVENNLEKLVSSTVPNASIIKRVNALKVGEGSVKRRLRSDTLADSPVRTLRSRNVDILHQTPKLKLKKIHSILPQVSKGHSRSMVAKRRRPMVLRSRLRKRMSK